MQEKPLGQGPKKEFNSQRKEVHSCARTGFGGKRDYVTSSAVSAMEMSFKS